MTQHKSISTEQGQQNTQ